LGDLSREVALSLSARLLWTAVYVCGPILGLSMVVGLAVSILQAVTQVQEASIAFVLKMLAVAAALLLFAAFQFAGRLMDTQLGFGVAGLIDPATGTQAPLLGTVLNMTAVMTFFLLGGHRLLIHGLAYSLTEIGPGLPLTRVPVTEIIAQFGAMFDHYDPGAHTIYWDPTAAMRTRGGETLSPALGLAHELAHAALDETSEVAGVAAGALCRFLKESLRDDQV
jgi:flagellar biosynthesis protein FliQ